MTELTGRITAAWLNSLSVEQRAAFLSGGWVNRMHQWAGSHVSYICWNRITLLGTRATNNASVFFMQFGSDLIAVTAAHVFDEYVAAKAKSPKRIACQIGNVAFDPAERLRSRGARKDIDIATFNISHRELNQVGKQALIGSPWPPPPPTVGQGVFLLGFPGRLRLWVDTRSMSFAAYNGLEPIKRITDQQVICALEREHCVASDGGRLPPAGLDLGGLSGGPLLLPLEADGQWHLTLAGVISETVFNHGVYSTRADFIRNDGTVSK